MKQRRKLLVCTNIGSTLVNSYIDKVIQTVEIEKWNKIVVIGIVCKFSLRISLFVFQLLYNHLFVIRSVLFHFRLNETECFLHHLNSLVKYSQHLPVWKGRKTQLSESSTYSKDHSRFSPSEFENLFPWDYFPARSTRVLQPAVVSQIRGKLNVYLGVGCGVASGTKHRLGHFRSADLSPLKRGDSFIQF